MAGKKPRSELTMYMATTTFVLAMIGPSPTVAQQTPCVKPMDLASLPLKPGMAVATCFSGIDRSGPALADGFVLAVFDTRLDSPQHPSPGTGESWCAAITHNEAAPAGEVWSSTNLGQVFGTALDDHTPPNIFVTATTVYGSNNPAHAGGFSVPLDRPHYGAAGPGAVYRIDGSTGSTKVFATLPNGKDGPALGNIAFSRAAAGDERFYVSNFEDGRVYALDGAGACRGTFDHASGAIVPDLGGVCDPESPPDGGFVPRGERVWAVQAFSGRLYYSLWVEDRGRADAGFNQIWSLSLDAAGDFVPKTAHVEWSTQGSEPLSTASNAYSNPVSDIAFSTEGRMLIAERTMFSDTGPGLSPSTSLFAHQSRNLELEVIASQWLTTSKILEVGSGSPGRNAAGGLGLDCTGGLWSTSDLMLDDTNPNDPDGFRGWAYGLQRTPAAGNATGSAAVGHFIDFNGEPGTQDKTSIGDVEVYRGCNACVDIVEEHGQVQIGADGLPTSCYTSSLTFTNHTDDAIDHMTVSGGTAPILLRPPVPAGETGDAEIELCNLTPGEEACVRVITANERGDECCTFDHCLPVPCWQLGAPTEVRCAAEEPGRYTVDLTLHLPKVEPLTDITVFAPSSSNVRVEPGQFPAKWGLAKERLTIDGAEPGSQVCLNVAVSCSTGACCTQKICFDLPSCSAPSGACCTACGCTQRPQADCEGRWHGAGSDCSQIGCPIDQCPKSASTAEP